MGTKSTFESLNFYLSSLVREKLLYFVCLEMLQKLSLEVETTQPCLFATLPRLYSVKTTFEDMYLDCFELILSFPFCVVEMVVLVGLPILGGCSSPPAEGC